MFLESLVIIIFGFGDLATTKIALDLGGHEKNPIMLFFLKRYGFVSLIIVKSIAILYIFYFAPKYKLFLIILGTIVVASNIRTIVKRQKTNLKSNDKF